MGVVPNMEELSEGVGAGAKEGGALVGGAPKGAEGCPPKAATGAGAPNEATVDDGAELVGMPKLGPAGAGALVDEEAAKENGGPATGAGPVANGFAVG